MASVVTQAERTSTLPVYSLRSVWLIGICFILSGATGLIYEVLWARMLGLVFGATTLAVSTVLAAFMGGLALGSALAGKFAPRIKRPFYAYGLLEIGIAIYAMLVPWLFSLVDNIYALIWQQFHPGFFAFSVWRFVLSSAMLLVPTTMMGATLPVLSAALMRTRTFKSTSVTSLYTCNLLGAIFGTLAAGFFLLPNLGVRATIFTAAFINTLIGLVAIFADRKDQSVEGTTNAEGVEGKSNTTEAAVSTTGIEDWKFWLFCAFVSGFVTISTQVAWTRLLAMIIGSSTYAFSIVVALFLIGLSLGAYVVGRGDYSTKLRRTICNVEIATGIGLFMSLFILNLIPAILVNLGLKFQLASWGGLLILQIFCAALLILMPAFLMGMVMPLVLVWASKGHSTFSVRLVGRSYAINTIGAIAGAFCAGFLLIPRTTTRFTILFAAALCLLTGGLAFQSTSQKGDRDLRRAFALGFSALLIIGIFTFPPQMNVADLSIGVYDSLVRELSKTRQVVTDQDAINEGKVPVHQTLMFVEGTTSTVSVRRDWDITSMAINGRTNASDKEDMPTQVMLAQLPVLLSPKIDNALIVGFASGVSVGSILQSPIQAVDCVELEPATIKGSKFFEHVNNQPLNDGRVKLIIDDARTYLRVTPTRYDIIVSEPSHPWVPGVANLFTEEFFQLGRGRLTDTGVFAQWLQIYQMSTNSLRSILATYQKVFPHVAVFRVGGAARGKDLILLGSMKPINLELIKERLQDAKISTELARVNMATEEEVRAWYVCDETKLGPAVAGAVINTDDNMHIETTVPREAFLPLMQTNGEWINSLK
jgi:spermidine synthase